MWAAFCVPLEPPDALGESADQSTPRCSSERSVLAMDSLAVPRIPAPGFASRGRRRRGNCSSQSLRSALAARHEISAGVAAFPASGKNFSLTQAFEVRFLWRSSPSRPVFRCNAGSAQDDSVPEPRSSSLGADLVEKGGGAGAVGVESRKGLDFGRLREELQTKRKRFWRDFKEQHVVYKRDRDQWGLGFSPIFTVHEDEDGNRYRVDVDEDEILRRSGVDPNMTQFADRECTVLAEERIELAKAHARDVELGLVNPSPLSISYEYKRRGASNTSTLGNGFWQGNSLTLPAAAPREWLAVSLLVPLLFLGIVVKWFSSKRRQDDDPTVKEKNARALQRKKLKAQLQQESSTGPIDNVLPIPQEIRGNGVANRTVTPEEEGVQKANQLYGNVAEAGLSGVNAEDFKRKALEIQAMARKARLQEQESAEARSAQSFERKKYFENEMKERRRVQRLENWSKHLDDVRRLGAGNADGPDLMRKEESNIPAIDNGQSSQSEIVSEDSDNHSQNYLDSDSLLRSGTLPLKLKPNSSKSSGTKPRMILSAEEARARIAAKRARSNASSPTSPTSKLKIGTSEVGFEQSNAVETPTSINSNEVERPSDATNLSAKESKLASTRELYTPLDDGTPAAGVSTDWQPEASSMRTGEKMNKSVTETNEPSSNSENVNRDYQERTEDREAGDSGRERGQFKSKDEEEEMEWLRDDVLREIVFKVHANEEAGREPFHNLNSEQETLFFKGLERKFEREGDEVKKWIKDRVENIDYGTNGISVHDSPESYELKWKAGVEGTSKSDFYDRFNQDRQRIIDQKRRLTYPTPPVPEEPSSTDLSEGSRLSSPVPPPSPSPLSSTASPVSSHASTPLSIDFETLRGRSKEKLLEDSKAKAVISSSPRAGHGTGPSPSTSPGTQTSEAGKGNWGHTKRWAKDLERKYAMEKDPAARALMREIGQDLDRWITEDEIKAASNMLDKGVEGEEEYVKMHYEKIREKIKRQRETFGRDSMLNKYSEYKEEAEEVELWWLNLPFVVCIGLRATVDGELQTGLYSVDVTPALDGVTGMPSAPYHTVAFQDRGDAQNFCTLVNSQPQKLNADGAEPVPFTPKDLYRDAKAEGFKVTVIKKGQLQLSVDKPFEEVESRILELGSARYYEEMLKDRMIDIGAAVDEGLGFGRGPR